MENNRKLAEIFSHIAQYLEMDDVPFKPAAYEKTSLVLLSLDRDVSEIYKQGGCKALLDIPSVGDAFSKKIEEFLKTRKVATYEKLKKKFPVDLEGLGQIEGLGPKKIKVLYQTLGIRNQEDLERAIEKHKIATLFGFGEKTEENFKQGLVFLKHQKNHIPLKKILPEANKLIDRLKMLKEVEKISLAGSVRRKKETIGDVDILVVSKKPERIMDYFVSMPDVEKIWGKGKTKSSVRLKQGFDADLRIVPAKSYGAALLYFTGSKEHNIYLRRLAIDKGYKLNEYGIFKGDKMIPTETEEKVYEILELNWIPPEKRF
ncbi:MAG: helix-hairpin-helix domain-containing protein [Candidatus Roizmanbacteria bacterium]